MMALEQHAADLGSKQRSPSRGNTTVSSTTSSSSSTSNISKPSSSFPASAKDATNVSTSASIKLTNSPTSENFKTCNVSSVAVSKSSTNSSSTSSKTSNIESACAASEPTATSPSLTSSTSSISGTLKSTANVVPKPLPPPPSGRRFSARTSLDRRSSSPCSVGSKLSFASSPTLHGRASTPTASQLSLGRQKAWPTNVHSKDSKKPESEKDGNLEERTREKNNATDQKPSGSMGDRSFQSTSKSSTVVRISPSLESTRKTLQKPEVTKSKNHPLTSIKLDPPPRKSKSQSPSRSRISGGHNPCSSSHTPIHVSKSTPPKKCQDLKGMSIKSAMQTTTLLNGFASTPPTPTVTITPTSSPPKHLFDDSFSHFVRDNCSRNGTPHLLENTREQSHKDPATGNRPSSPNRQSGIGGFEGLKRASVNESEIIPSLPPPPAKSRVVKLLDIGDSSEEKTNEDQSLDKMILCSALQLPDLPDLIYSGASSSEGTDSPFKLPATPTEDPDSRLHPGTPTNLILVDPYELSDEELRDFAMKWGSPHHAPTSRSMLLSIPPPTSHRPRVTSLPAPQTETLEDEEHYRLRHFSIIGRGIVNRGDSIKTRRSKSNTCALDSLTVVPAASAGAEAGESRSSALSPTAPPSITLSCDDVSKIHCLDGLIKQMNEVSLRNPKWRGAWSNPCSLRTSAASSVASSRASSTSECCVTFRVVVLGAAGVGKTSLCRQFMTSEHINAYETSVDDEFGEQSVSVLLDGEESEMQFVDHPADEMSVENFLSTYEPHAVVVVFSVVDECSFLRAEEILQYLWRSDVCENKGVILVANKTDLVRSRCIHTKEASTLAASYDCKFIETSSALNHRVDELLVGVLKQIRLKSGSGSANHDSGKKRSNRRKFRGRKTSASVKVKSFLTKVCGKEPKSKSCENLLVL